MPHIFTEREIGQVLRATQDLSFNLESPLRRQVARLAVVLLYTTGLRRGEVVRLTMGDYEPAERLLVIRDTKFHKSRLVPLSDDAVSSAMKCLSRNAWLSNS
jgi:site-specific recombinase XerD